MRIENIENLYKEFSLSTDKGKIAFEKDPFEKFFDEAVSLLEQTNSTQMEAEKKQIDFITGKTDDIIGLTMAQSRASSAIQFTTQVANKILTAYQEIMRIAI